ncbi:SpoIIE family protein phosphatase [Magnetococcus sp. PR-3]|uniref:SpoIIE family protein phosphatase n=1 Tax=Magnetococcus sp. PR-3 TaxID=3120355 RepID=UPI002FCE0A2C
MVIPSSTLESRQLGQIRHNPENSTTQERRRRSLMEHLHMFRGIKDERVLDILQSCPVYQFEKETVLLHQGEVNHNVYLVLSGEIKVLLDETDEEQHIMIPAGKCVGDMSVLDAQPVSAQVVACAGARIVEMNHEVFFNDMLTIPGVAKNMLMEQMKRVRRSNATVLSKREKELRLEQLEQELSIAGQIQNSVLPHTFPSLELWPWLSIAAHMIPARDIGGDLYDIFALDEHRLFIQVGDVSGKGVPAALHMMRTSALFQVAARTEHSPLACLQHLNTPLKESSPSFMFVTAFCAIFDVRTGEITYANAAHLPPVIKKKDGSTHFIDMQGGMVLGILDQPDFSTGCFTLNEGESLVLYSDGVTEAMNAQEEMFEDSRLLQALEKTEHCGAQHLVDQLFSQVQSFANGFTQSDDITVVALHRGQQ